MLSAEEARALALSKEQKDKRVQRHFEYISRLIEAAARNGKTSLVLNGYIDEGNPQDFFNAVRKLCAEQGFKQSDTYVNKTMQHIALGRAYIHRIVW
jgi:hypothetical protein